MISQHTTCVYSSGLWCWYRKTTVHSASLCLWYELSLAVDVVSTEHQWNLCRHNITAHQIIGHVTIWFPIGHFLLVVLWNYRHNMTSDIHCVWSIKYHNDLGWRVTVNVHDQFVESIEQRFKGHDEIAILAAHKRTHQSMTHDTVVQNCIENYTPSLHDKPHH